MQRFAEAIGDVFEVLPAGDDQQVDRLIEPVGLIGARTAEGGERRGPLRDEYVLEG
jgi:hypothetical protein